jgi:hypothetical protein
MFGVVINGVTRPTAPEYKEGQCLGPKSEFKETSKPQMQILKVGKENYLYAYIHDWGKWGYMVNLDSPVEGTISYIDKYKILVECPQNLQTQTELSNRILNKN